ncbi:FAD-dependent monooxygenase [Streptomyces subrutilus]|uniref:FAD-binding domain-containing protein n=1 Tax=Streptomyces subrutilus TaxID=36818 RepID=A0A1E5P034_9ACTN|nr:FAD-dependent monooxygenase [Streptomyces subrutilus]OEJ22427.1 hypothetical protein BGK67_33325 [Streptomyces subrutilus]
MVVGGGPVGMLIAAELAGYGVDTLLLEVRDRVSVRPKATTLHARAVQCLARRGHLPEQRARHTGAASSSPFHFAGLPGLVITAPETEPEPILKCPQAELERRFEERARAAGARILREHRVTDAVQDRDGVRVTADGPGGPVTCTTRYAVGADGARSMLRELAGIESDIHAATVAALMATVTVTDPDVLPPGWHRTPRGWIVAKRDPAGSTHIRTLNCTGAHEDRKLPPTLEDLRREASWIAGRDIAMEDARWLSRFSDVTRLARTFRSGRVFLVGDAAHVHFPIGGQGLSTGVLDALNLGWKLALAVHGKAGADLLDTYDLERRPAAQRVIDNTRAQLALMRPGAEADALRGVFAAVLAEDPRHERLSGMISAQDTVYPGRGGCLSPTEGAFLGNMPLHTDEGETDVIELLRDGRPLLLLFGEKGDLHGREALAWAGILRVVHVLPTAAAPADALLVRPDGYLAWTSEGGRLANALEVHFARKEPAPVAGLVAQRSAAVQPTASASIASATARASV